jgi:hypothetical protein
MEKLIGSTPGTGLATTAVLVVLFGIAGGEFVGVRVQTNPLSAWSR